MVIRSACQHHDYSANYRHLPFLEKLTKRSFFIRGFFPTTAGIHQFFCGVSLLHPHVSPSSVGQGANKFISVICLGLGLMLSLFQPGVIPLVVDSDNANEITDGMQWGVFPDFRILLSRAPPFLISFCLLRG